MKKSILLLAAMVLSTVVGWAQNGRTWSLNLGAQREGIGLNYEIRLKNPQWGYQVGMAYGFGRSSESLFGTSSHLNVYSVPMNVNYLVGQKKSALEVGVGQTLLYFKNEYDYVSLTFVGQGQATGEVQHATDKGMGYYMFSNIGYRYTGNGGFQFRIGLTPTYSWGGNVEKGMTLGMYITLGKSF